MENQENSAIDATRVMESRDKDIRSALSFSGRAMYLDEVKKKPLKTLANLFNYTRDDSVKEALFEWEIIAFSSLNANEYSDGLGVAEAIVFFNELGRLIEAWYWLCYHDADFERLREQGAWQIPRVHFNTINLPPEKIIADFKGLFSWKYCRSELWYMLEAVIGYKGNVKIRYASMLMKYEQLLCMAKAAYHYSLKPPFTN